MTCAQKQQRIKEIDVRKAMVAAQRAALEQEWTELVSERSRLSRQCSKCPCQQSCKCKDDPNDTG